MSSGNTTPRGYQRPKMTDKERQELMDANKCFYCKEEGHKALICPRKPQKNTAATVNEIAEEECPGKASP